MRQILIKTVYKEGKMHVIRLGNGTVFEFTSVKSANKFLADTNQFLTDRLFSLNHVFSEVFSFYHNAWMVDPATRGHFGRAEIESMEHTLFQAYFLAPTRSGSYSSFIHPLKFCRFSKAFFKTLYIYKTGFRQL